MFVALYGFVLLTYCSLYCSLHSFTSCISRIVLKINTEAVAAAAAAVTPLGHDCEWRDKSTHIECIAVRLAAIHTWAVT